MYVVRDNSRRGKAVTWGTDHGRLKEIAESNPDYELWPDLGAKWHYWYVDRKGLNWVNPYDLDAATYAEIKP